jgi:glucosamine-6-phosphate deaminase
MKLKLINSYEEMSKITANIVKKQIINKPDSVIGFATGDTPLGMYKELVKIYRKNELDFSKVITFNLDEYLGLEPEHTQSYHYYMNNNFFKYINCINFESC